MSTTEMDLGDRVVDRESNSDTAIVVKTPGRTTTEWDIRGRGTVAADNPNYPEDDRVIITVFEPELKRNRPYYSGIKPLSLSDLVAEDVSFYAFPESRLRRVGQIQPPEIQLDELSPSPYHARSFSANRNEDFIESIKDEGPPRPPLVRVTDKGFEICNGHKRVWASYVAGLDSVPCWCIYADDLDAARIFVNNHLDSYGPEEQGRAVSKLRSMWGDTLRKTGVSERHLEGSASA